jgi:serine/threonine protein phosphatase PrpC
VAAQAAVDAVLEVFGQWPAVTADAVATYVDAAHAAVHARQGERPEWGDARSTVVVLVANGTQALWGHVGDSRLYRFRGARLVGQTQDHSVPQALVAAGEISAREARVHEDRNRVLRALGRPEAVEAAIAPAPVPVASDDAFLLCTDGLWEGVTELEMTAERAKALNADDWLRRLEDRVLLSSSAAHDNYTALAICAL